VAWCPWDTPGGLSRVQPTTDSQTWQKVGLLVVGEVVVAAAVAVVAVVAAAEKDEARLPSWRKSSSRRPKTGQRSVQKSSTTALRT
jgi:hypothetical protein